MKKFLAILLASAVSIGTFAFLGCGGNTPTGDGGDSGISKPVMPTDSDMQTVEEKNIYDEAFAFYSKLKESQCGKFSAYYLTSENTVSNGEQREADGQEWLDKTEKATYTEKSILELSDNYASINNNGFVTGVVTNHRNRITENKVDSKNPNLAYLNKNLREERVNTSIQKGSQLYNFYARETNDNGKISKTDRYLNNYVDVAGIINKVFPADIPCLEVMEKIDMYNALAIHSVLGLCCNNVYFYLETNDELNLLNLTYDELDVCISKELKNFEYFAKANENKFYASLKFTVELTLVNDTTKTYERECAVLIDLSEPNAVTELPSNGINVENLGLNTIEDKIVYPDVSTEQLTNAVKDGKEITVNVAGDGSMEKLVITCVNGDPLLVSDGEATLNCARIKEYLDEMREIYEEVGVPIKFFSIFEFTYYYDENDMEKKLVGRIYIDY